MDNEEARSIMFKALKNGKISRIIRAAYTILGHPVIITDASFRKLTEVYPAEKTGDPKWNRYLGRESLDLEALRAFLEHDYLHSLQLPHVFYYKEGYFSDSPQLCAPVIFSGRIRGYVAILCPVEDYSAELSSLLEIIADAVSIYMRTGAYETAHAGSVRQAFTNALFSGELREKGKAEAWAVQLGLNLEPGYCLLAISYKQNSVNALHSYLSLLISNAGMPILVHQEEKCIFVLLYGQNSPEYNNLYVQQIGDTVSQLDYVCGISQDFSDLTALEEYRKQAESAMLLQLPETGGSRIRYYRNLSLRIILQTAAEKLGEKNCIHPAVPYLEEYDRTYDTEYLVTLREYLRNSCRSSETCESLHIHRNTLNYRINKIEHLAGLDLGDEYIRTHLSISLMLTDEK